MISELSPEDIDDLKSSLRSDPPVNFKGNYTLAHQSKGIVRVLRRRNIEVNVDNATGEITLERI